MRLRDGTDVSPASFIRTLLPVGFALWLPPVGLVWCILALRRASGSQRQALLVGVAIGGVLTGLAVLGIIAGIALGTL